MCTGLIWTATRGYQHMHISRQPLQWAAWPWAPSSAQPPSGILDAVPQVKWHCTSQTPHATRNNVRADFGNYWRLFSNTAGDWTKSLTGRSDIRQKGEGVVR